MFKKVTVILFVLLLLSSCSLKNINLTEPESASLTAVPTTALTQMILSLMNTAACG